MDYFKMYLGSIESNKQALAFYIKRYGFKENLGQIEQREFTKKVNSNDKLTQAQKADLTNRFAEMLDNLN